MLVINPDECIDCGVCEPECPAGAIVPDINLSENDKYWLKINTEYSKLWPNIYQQKEPMPDSEQWDPTKGYLGNKNELFDPNGPTDP